MSGWKPFEKQGRRWLEPNNLSVDSYIKWSVTVEDRYTAIELKIADCNENVTLYFDLEDDGLQKVDRILNLLQELRTTMLQAQKHLNKRPAVK